MGDDVLVPQEERWRAWLATRPESVRRFGEQLKPWHLYRLRSTGHVVQIYSIDEPGAHQCAACGECSCAPSAGDATCSVAVLHKWNPQGLAFERRVFGIGLDDLERLPRFVDDELADVAGKSSGGEPRRSGGEGA